MDENPLHPALKKLCTSLDDLAKQVKDGWNDDRSLNENWGWNHPVMTRSDLSSHSSDLADEIREKGTAEPEKNVINTVEWWQSRFPHLKQVAQYFYNGNGAQAVPVYLASIAQLRKDLEPILGWQTVRDTNSLPPKLARRIRSYTAELDQIAPNKEELTKRIALINEATSAAETLPTDLEALAGARKTIEELQSKSSVMHEKISEYSSKSLASMDAIHTWEKGAAKLVSQCEEAYKITTTKGLAGAFTQRHHNLTYSMWAWVVVLVAALGVGYYFGAQRLKDITSILNSAAEQKGALWPNAILALFSLGAPIWLAWIATKQIGQRFRLAEDYAYKATVAKAYEGYRKEAARIDEDFEARLFDSALTRLEEAPLRLVETKTHGSPWHEFLESEAFREALKVVPGFREQVKKLGRKAANGDGERVSAKLEKPTDR